MEHQMTSYQIKSTLGYTLLVSIVLLSMLFSYRYLSNGRYIQSTDNAYIRGEIVAIAPKVSGYISEVLVSDHQSVNAGDALFRIAPHDYEVRLAQAVAGMKAAQASQTSLREKRKLQEAFVKEAEARLVSNSAEAKRAKRDRRRASNLFEQGWTTEQRNDNAITLESRSQAAVSQAKAGLAAQKQRLTVIDAEAAQIIAAVENAEAQLELAQITLNDTVAHAPVAGIVGNKHIEVGQYARPGAPLLSIVSNKIWVEANFKETQLNGIAPGQIVTIQVDTFSDTDIRGYVDSLSPASGAQFSLLPPDNASGNFVRVVQRVPVKISLNEQQTLMTGLRPGLSAKVQIDTRQRIDPEYSKHGDRSIANEANLHSTLSSPGK